jgi:hypothetical protein
MSYEYTRDKDQIKAGQDKHTKIFILLFGAPKTRVWNALCVPLPNSSQTASPFAAGFPLRIPPAMGRFSLP